MVVIANNYDAPRFNTFGSNVYERSIGYEQPILKIPAKVALHKTRKMQLNSAVKAIKAYREVRRRLRKEEVRKLTFADFKYQRMLRNYNKLSSKMFVRRA